MKVKTILTLTTLAAALALSGCNREGEEQAPSQSSTAPSELSGSGATGSQMAPNAANEAGGNEADQNRTDAVPTQKQLDPTPSTNEPSGSITPARP